jgi:chromate transporter
VASTPRKIGLTTVLVEWGRIGVIGFGGPTTHIALLRQRCVDERRWIDPREFEDSIAVCNLLPGPASTQLAILCARRVAGRAGAIVGGLAFIIPGFVAVVALAALFLASSPPAWVLAVGAGAGAAIPAVALNAGIGLAKPSWNGTDSRLRWTFYALVGVVTAAMAGPFVVVALLVCGFVEVMTTRFANVPAFSPFIVAAGAASVGSLGALAWVAFKVGALSYGGGFVIIPLMQHDAVSVHHWMTDAQFLNAVALGQVTPGPVVLTVAAVGFAASGIGGAALATLVAFAPSFLFVLAGVTWLDQLRESPNVRAFLRGAGPTAIGAIIGVALPLALALGEWWQCVVLGLMVVWLTVARRGVVSAIVGAGVIGLVLHLLGAPLPNVG